MPKLADIVNCSGCSACASVCPKSCIRMVESAEGFYVPAVSGQDCVDCGLCEKACPQLTDRKSSVREPSSVFAAWSRDEESRRKSSSGAVSYELAATVIESGGVFFGVVNDGDVVRHCAAQTIAELERMRGSKYVQSQMGTAYKDAKGFLDAGRRVLFSGTPCQVAGLKSFLGDHQEGLLSTIDIVCHGVPPARLFKQYLRELSTKGERVEYQFRSSDGWTKVPVLRVDGIERSGDAFEYNTLFDRKLILNEACYRCRYADQTRVGDITLGDFWGIGDSVPFEADTSGGCSLVLVNTSAGLSLLEGARERLVLAERTFAEARAANTCLREPSSRPDGRSSIMKVIERRGFSAAVRRFVLLPSLPARVYRRIHHVLHLIKRPLCRKSV